MRQFIISSLAGKLVILFFFILSPVSYAADSTGVGLRAMNPQTLQPTTAEKSDEYVVHPDAGSQFSCPKGYALTKFVTTAERHVAIDVFGQPITHCYGAGWGVVYSECKNHLETYSATAHGPLVTYTCQKIKNQWVSSRIG